MSHLNESCHKRMSHVAALAWLADETTFKYMRSKVEILECQAYTNLNSKLTFENFHQLDYLAAQENYGFGDQFSNLMCDEKWKIVGEKFYSYEYFVSYMNESCRI